MSFGLYVHYPYCRQLCPYCDFSKTVGTVHKDGAYGRALTKEMGIRAPRFSNFGTLDTIYVGGGTPSLWPMPSFLRWLNDAKTHFSLSDDIEVTFEVNPEDVTLDGLKRLKDGGVNRISLGAQSFNEKVLRRLGRLHTPADVMNSIIWIQESGFDNWNVDLMHGVIGQTLAEVMLDLRQALDFGTPHLSTYQLSIDPDSFVDEGESRLPLVQKDDGLLAAMYQAIVNENEAQGRAQYELTCAAIPGFESRHNLGYWQGRPYLALGAGAHGFCPQDEGAIRFENVSRVSEYLTVISQSSGWGDLPSTELVLNQNECLEDSILTGLRLSDGIKPTQLMQNRYGDRVKAMVKAGLMYDDSARWRTSAQGRLMLDYITEQILVIESNSSES